MDPYTEHLDPYQDTGKTCFGGGMHCLRASSLVCMNSVVNVTCFVPYFYQKLAVVPQGDAQESRENSV